MPEDVRYLLLQSRPQGHRMTVTDGNGDKSLEVQHASQASQGQSKTVFRVFDVLRFAADLRALPLCVSSEGGLPSKKTETLRFSGYFFWIFRCCIFVFFRYLQRPIIDDHR